MLIVEGNAKVVPGGGRLGIDFQAAAIAAFGLLGVVVLQQVSEVVEGV